MDKNNKTKPLQVYMTVQMLSAVGSFASRIGASASSYVRQAIVEKMNRDQKQAD